MVNFLIVELLFGAACTMSDSDQIAYWLQDCADERNTDLYMSVYLPPHLRIHLSVSPPPEVHKHT